MPRDRVFLSYSRADEVFMQEARIQLKAAGIPVFLDQEIPVGDDWKDHIDTALASTRVALLLVSPHFLTSDFILTEELPPTLKAAEDRELTVYWVLVSDCIVREDINRFQAAHRSPPLDQMKPAQRAQVWAKICKQLKPKFP